MYVYDFLLSCKHVTLAVDTCVKYAAMFCWVSATSPSDLCNRFSVFPSLFSPTIASLLVYLATSITSLFNKRTHKAHTQFNPNPSIHTTLNLPYVPTPYTTINLTSHSTPPPQPATSPSPHPHPHPPPSPPSHPPSPSPSPP